MSLSIPFKGSGEFVPVRVWSCSQHKEPQEHYCDCDCCDRNGYTCDECADSEWVDKIGDDGQIVMRELSVYEQGFLRLWEARGPTVAMAPVAKEAKIEWLEDEMFPSIRA